MPCVDRNKLVYNIKELPEVFNVEPVDLFIVETLDGTSIVSFDNIIFDLTQTTFETAFNKHTTDIQTLSADVDQIINNAGSGYDHSLLESTSGDWNSNYSTVQAYSASWAPTSSSMEYITSTAGSGGGQNRVIEVPNPRPGVLPYAVSCFIQENNSGGYIDIGYTNRASGTDGGLAYGGTSFTDSTIKGYLKGTTGSIKARWVIQYEPV